MASSESRKGSAESATPASSSSQPPEGGAVSTSDPKPQADPARRPSAALPQTTSAPAFRLPKSPHDGPPAKVPKIAIPRLPHRGESSAGAGTKSGGRHRVMHACEPCRTRKTKCSGEKPACKHCQDFKVNCMYADGKRDRAKKAFGSLADKVSDYETVLREISSRVCEEDANLIKTLLAKDVLSGNDTSPGAADASQDADGVSEDGGGESDVSAGVGSTGAVDRIEEDFNRNQEARTTGFMGKNSEITWLQKLRQENMLGSPSRPDSEVEFRNKTGGASPLFESRPSAAGERKTLPDANEGYSVNAASYHLDDFAISVPDTIDRLEIPPRETADHLFNAYIDSVHPSFPIIGKITFSSQYRRFMEGPSSNPGERWLAILNMIFAIGAKYSHLVQADWRGDDRDHLIYFSRARLLSMNGSTIFNHADLQQVQVSTLISFYLLATSQINRAWTIGGTAVRAAIALGINMRNDSMRTPNTSKEIRYRVWWSLYTLEHQLSLMTGRPTSISDGTCTTPYPIPMEEDAFQSSTALNLLGSEMQKHARYPKLQPRSPNTNNPSSTASSSDRSRSVSKPTSASRSPSTPQRAEMEWAKHATPSSSLYFLHLIQLTKLSQSVLTRIYTPEAMKTTWSRIQTIISELEEQIIDWHINLPVVFDFKRRQRDQAFAQHRMCLGFFYYGTRIIIHRPCLCRLDRKIPFQSAKSQDFNRSSAGACIDAAREMLLMLPDDPNAIGLNRIGPWWSIIHSLMQAAVVLLLELSFRADHMPEEAENIFEAAKKAVRWLHNLGEESYSARRGWALCNSMLREAAPKIGRQADHLPEEAPGPLDEPVYPDAEMSGAMNVPGGMPSSPQYGANFSAPQQDPANMPIFSGYDQYLSYSGSEHPGSFFPTSVEMEFINEAYSDPMQLGDFSGPQLSGA